MSDAQTKNLSIYDSKDVSKLSSQLPSSSDGGTNFEHLMLRGVSLDEKESASLSHIINTNKQIWRNIDIHHCGGSSYAVLTAAIERDLVRQVRLVNVDAGDNGFALLGKALAVNTSLTYLRLTTTILEGSNVALFASGLQDNKTLQCIDFKYSVFGESGCHELARGLRRNQSIQDINLSGCNLTDEHAEILIRAFHHHGHSSLETMDLNGNFCGHRASTALADILRSPSCKLRKLDIGCQRGNGSFNSKLLSAALASNSSLEVLDISNMSLGDEHAKHLVEALVVNTALRDLYLSRNRVTVEGINYLAERLPEIKGLKKLSLWGNLLTESAADKLLEGLRDNYNLECLELFQEFKSSREVKHLTLLNRGGRRIFQNCPNTILPGMWPHLMERINTRRMAKIMRRWDDDFDDASKREAIFYFLQSPALLNR
jgi:Ran GTPase-activating protein (RanGAP) involved in mRNA processing and transport